MNLFGKGTFPLLVIHRCIFPSIPSKKKKTIPPSHPRPPSSHPFKRLSAYPFSFISLLPTPLASWQEAKLMQLVSPTTHMANSRTWRLFSRNTRKACPTRPYRVPTQIQTFKPSSIFFLSHPLVHLHSLVLPFDSFLLLSFPVSYFINLSSNLAAPPFVDRHSLFYAAYLFALLRSYVKYIHIYI